MATLAGLTTRVQTALMDTGAKVWDTGTITEGIRLAVGEYSLAGEAAVTVDGLDGAGSSDLPAIHDSVIVVGAAAYAALARSADRADSYQLQGDAAALKAWGDARLREFKGMLGFIFPGYLVTLSGTSEGGSEDPAKLAAEIALLTAQTGLAEAQADLVTAQTAAVGNDAAKIAAEADLLTAQAGLADVQAQAATGEEGRAAAAAAQAAQDRIDEAARLASLRVPGSSGNPAWGTWEETDGIDYGEGFDRS